MPGNEDRFSTIVILSSGFTKIGEKPTKKD